MNKEKEITKKTIPAKILAIQGEIGSITKLAYNAFQKYHYFTELQVLKMLKPLLQKHSLTLMISDDISQSFLHEKEGTMHLVKYLKKMVISDEQNSLEFSFWAAGSNQDLAKAKGVAETYAMKYLLSKFFLIPIQDEEEPDQINDETSLTNEKESTTKKKSLPFTPHLTATIQNVENKTDKSGKQYLLLTLDQLEKNVFVWEYQVPTENWSKLKKTLAYQFHLEESKKGPIVLLDFKEIE